LLLKNKGTNTPPTREHKYIIPNVNAFMLNGNISLVYMYSKFIAPAKPKLEMKSTMLFIDAKSSEMKYEHINAMPPMYDNVSVTITRPYLFANTPLLISAMTSPVYVTMLFMNILPLLLLSDVNMP
jgi:hypothetical protein